MTWVATAVVGSAAVGLYSANKAAGAQEAAAGQAAGISREQYAQTRADQEPWRLAGERALGKLEAASDYTPFGMAQFQADPGYGFRLSEGQKTLDRQAAARGGLISGGALKAAQRYGQEMGSQEYTNAFNRYQTERQAKLGPLQSLAGVGQTAVNQLGAAGQNYAASASEAAGAAGQARASGYMGGANAISGGVGSYLGYQGNTNLVNALNARNIGAVVGPTNMSQQGYAIQSGGY
jgi:hypothetical protein